MTELIGRKQIQMYNFPKTTTIQCTEIREVALTVGNSTIDSQIVDMTKK